MTPASGFPVGVRAATERSRRVELSAQGLHKQHFAGACAHFVRWMTLVVTTSCVVPIPASPEDSDAGPQKDTPVILEASPTDFPGPLQLPGTENVLLTVRDHDVTDTLYIRVFLNYKVLPNKGILDLSIPPNTNGGAERTRELKTEGWCPPTGAQNLTMDIVIADEPLRDSLADEFPFKTPTNDGRWSERNYIVACSGSQ